MEPTPVYVMFKNKFDLSRAVTSRATTTTTTLGEDSLASAGQRQQESFRQTGTTTPGAMAVSPSPPTSTYWSENDNVSEDERRVIENAEDMPRLASARLVQDREEQLARGNKQLRQQIVRAQQQEQHQTRAVAIPVLDNPTSKSYWKMGLAALLTIGAIVVVIVLVTLALRDDDSSPSLILLMDVIAAEPRLSTFYHYMQSTGLENVIRLERSCLFT